jgi:transcriptional accessory protein Tex/SPT6
LFQAGVQHHKLREEFPCIVLVVSVSLGDDCQILVVKVDPKAIGGQYQHDVDQTKLKNLDKP